MSDPERRARAQRVFSETVDGGGGSTMSVHTGEFAEPHWGDTRDPSKPSHYIVGGESNPETGQRYATRTMRAPLHMLSSVQWQGVLPETHDLPEFTESAVAEHIGEMQGHAARAQAAGRPVQTGTSIGTWAVPEDNPRHGQIDIDASALHSDKFLADEIATRRGEEAVFGTNPGRNVPTIIGAAKGMEYHPEDTDLREHHRAIQAQTAQAAAEANEAHFRRIA